MSPTRILVVDDCPSLRTALRMMLEHAGYEVLEERDGRRALEAARRHLPHLVLLDLRMPVLNGIQAAQALTRDFRTASIPIIAISGHQSADAEALRHAGFCAFLPKPFVLRELLGHVRSCLGDVEPTRGPGDPSRSAEEGRQAA